MLVLEYHPLLLPPGLRLASRNISGRSYVAHLMLFYILFFKQQLKQNKVMARRAWLLVEWVDESNVFPSYGVVNIDTFAYKDLGPGKEIFISLKFNEPKRAKVIRISDNKQNVQEHKAFLERQDKQVQNVLQLCMRTIKEMKSEQFNGSSSKCGNEESESNLHNNLPHIVSAAVSDDSASENESQNKQVISYGRQKPSTKRVSHPQQQHFQPNNNERRISVPTLAQRRQRSMISSTPIPEKREKVLNKVKLTFDQATQTDSSLLQPPLEKIEEIETVLKYLYGRFQSLVTRIHSNSTNVSLDLSDTEHNDETSFIDPVTNESWVATSVPNAEDQVNVANETSINNADVDNGHNNTNVINTKVNIKNEPSRPGSVESITRVRRMSAQTTNSMELVPIGDGNAMVPARLLNDIDWNSHTTATRQLLQAIFSRKVLATHSLTGKQSPAHMNKPAKKVLDPKLVEDIVKTVSGRCGVAKNLVRNSITVKCTDEAKLYRNRLQYQQARTEKHRQNAENIPPPGTPSSDDLATVAS